MCKDICLFSHSAIKHIVATDNERQMIACLKGFINWAGNGKLHLYKTIIVSEESVELKTLS